MTKSLKFIGISSLSTFIFFGCMGRQAEIKDASYANAELIKGQKISELYYVPFDTSTVQLNGDHGDAKTAAENKGKWSTHVMVGMMDQLKDDKSEIIPVIVRPQATAYDTMIMNKTSKKFNMKAQAPSDAFVVTGKYILAENVGGASRAFFGVMSGKTYTRADIKIKRGNKVLFSGIIDGKYMGGGYSWGYESLAANEGLGKEIVSLVQRLQAGTAQ